MASKGSMLGVPVGLHSLLGKMSDKGCLENKDWKENRNGNGDIETEKKRRERTRLTWSWHEPRRVSNVQLGTGDV